MKTGFIGQGFIGKNYSDDLEKRGFGVVRYALEEPYNKNLEELKQCDVVFIAVPTPTTPNGFDSSIVRDVIRLVKKGATAVIKSTLAVGSTEILQKENPDIFVLHSPEFLSVATAAEDAAHPDRNIIGIPVDNEEYRKRAEEVLAVLPEAPYTVICNAKTAELIKHSHNAYGYVNVVYTNLLYDLAVKLGVEWDVIKEAMEADPMISNQYLNPIHKSGRGAGGACFIKDFESFIRMYEKAVGDISGINALKGIREKNIDLLINSKKDLPLLEGVYGDLAKRNIQ